MLVIWFSLGFLIAQLFLGAPTFQIIKEETELVTMQKKLFDYVSSMNKAIQSKIGEIDKLEVNTTEKITTSAFIDSLLVGLKLEIYLKPNNLDTIITLLGSQIEHQPNIVWTKNKLEILSKRKSVIFEVLKQANRNKLKWRLTKIEENMR